MPEFHGDKPLRVCIMNDNFYRSSGAAIAIRRLSRELTGVEYFIAGCRNDGLPEDLSWIPAHRYERFDLKTSNPARLANELVRFKRWFKRQKLDLVHCHHRRISALINAWGIPVLYTGQLTFPHAIWFRLLHPKRMTAITPSVAQNLRETTGGEVLACIGNPTEFPKTPPFIDLEKVKNSAVCVGRLEAVKGHKHLLAAWKLLLDRGHRYRLDIVGEGPLRGELEEQSRHDGTSNLIRFCGFNQNVSEFLGNSLFAILVSRVEGQGIVTLEAAAMGRATLLTAVHGSVDLIPPGAKLTNGLAYGNVKELAEAVQSWFAHPDDVVREGEQFFHFLKHSSDPKMVACAYRDIYRTIVSGAA
jgi:glycosyltransferase involved in cell wall biosynthesis